MRKFFASILSFFKRFRITWRRSGDSEVLVALERLQNSMDRSPPAYVFPHMSRMVDRLMGGNPCLSRSEDPGIVRMITKCDKVMSANEAQSVLDESRVKYQYPSIGQCGHTLGAKDALKAHNKKFHEIN